MSYRKPSPASASAEASAGTSKDLFKETVLTAPSSDRHTTVCYKSYVS